MDGAIIKIFRAHYHELRGNFDAATRSRSAVIAAAWSCAMCELAEVFAEIYDLTTQEAEDELSNDDFPF